MITLKTLPDATAQEVFDQVAEHLLKQGEQSVGVNGCLYRGVNGMKCAAGCLISDEEYSEGVEGASWTGLAGNPRILAGRVPHDHKHLISELQQIHDGCSPDTWPTLLQELAESESITWKFGNP